MLSTQTRKPFFKYLLLLRPTGQGPPMLLKPLQKQRLTLYDPQNAFCKCFNLVGHVAPFLNNRRPFHILLPNQTPSAARFLTNSPPEEGSHRRSTFLSSQNSSSFEKRGIHTIRWNTLSYGFESDLYGPRYQSNGQGLVSRVQGSESTVPYGSQFVDFDFRSKGHDSIGRASGHSSFSSRWGEIAMNNHRAPSKCTSHGDSIIKLVVCVTVDTRSDGQSICCRPAGRHRRARDTLDLDSQSESKSKSRWSESGSAPPPSAYNPSWTTGNLNRPLFWQQKSSGLVPGKLNRCYCNHDTSITHDSRL
jgi:hypothetical protein